MKFGAVLPQLEIGADPLAIRDYAQAVEGMGYDYLLAYEHVLGANPAAYPDRHFVYTHETMFHEPMVLFGYLAGITARLEFVTGILILPQRPTVLVAKQAAEVDVLSGGRLRLGIGVGWNQVELEGLGYEFHNRGQRTDEQIEVLRALWTQPLVTFEGQYHSLREVGINPLPVQRPIPLWFGGRADAMLRRMARFGAGWLPNEPTAGDAQPTIDRLHAYLEEAGRDPAKFGIDARLNVTRHPQTTWGEFVESWQAAGATHIGVNTMGAGYASLDGHLEALRAFRELVG
ncbi:MAG: LLM class F420-dependent oxidoreductase [Anaerolineae bacterium]|nr:LLM class F420-dependent oxidoreductase [Anaerolineae bacterium]